MTEALPARTALYPGSFDPMTSGHVDIVRRALDVFDRVVIAIAVNPKKTPTFTPDERVDMIAEVFADEPRIEVVSFTGLLVDYCKSRGIRSVVRGLRAVSDFEFEFQLASMNRRLTDEVDFIFLMTGEANFFVSSSLIREVAMNGGDVSGLVPTNILARLEARFNRD